MYVRRYARLATSLLLTRTTSFPGPTLRTPVCRPYFSTDPRLNCGCYGGRFDTSGCIQDRLNFFRACNLAVHEVTDWPSGRTHVVGGLIRCDLWLCSRTSWQFPHDDVMEIYFTVLCVVKTSISNLLTRGTSLDVWCRWWPDVESCGIGFVNIDR